MSICAMGGDDDTHAALQGCWEGRAPQRPWLGAGQGDPPASAQVRPLLEGLHLRLSVTQAQAAALQLPCGARCSSSLTPRLSDASSTSADAACRSQLHLVGLHLLSFSWGGAG